MDHGCDGGHALVGNLEQHLSESRYAESYRMTLELPDKTMERSCRIVLECCTQKRPEHAARAPGADSGWSSGETT
jgi:hypothetical protein